MGKHVTYNEFLKRANRSNQHFASGEIKIVGTYVNTVIPIEFKCSKGHTWFTTPEIIFRGYGCPYCGGKKVWIGFNDLWTTRPDVAKLLNNPNDGYKYTYGSKKKVEFVCPDCGDISFKQINNVSHYGFTCLKCSDGISYPAKYIRAFLSQLPIESFICEYQPDWAKPYFYDNYFKYGGIEYIVEVDGAQHYSDLFFDGTSLLDRQTDDRIKNELASDHNIILIRLDCSISNDEYIKENVLTSKLNNIFDLSAVDWTTCELIAQKSLVKMACDLYMTVTHNLSDIANKLLVNCDTVRKYLKVGAKIGLCDYNTKEFRKRVSKPVILISNNDDIVMEFDSINHCSRQMYNVYNIIIHPTSVTRSCKTRKPYKGFNFRFANEINNENSQTNICLTMQN